MSHRPEKFLSKPHLWLIRALGVIIPRRLRADWRQEWEAELRYRETLLAEWDKLEVIRSHVWDNLANCPTLWRFLCEE